MDGFGFTPLMYAATLDQGETGALEALLKAGADRSVKNEEGCTPLQQAHRLGHTQHAKSCAVHSRSSSTIGKLSRKLRPVACEQPPRANVLNTGLVLILRP